jgi:hypothetical protein
MQEIGDVCDICRREEGKHPVDSGKYKYHRIVCDQCLVNLLAAIRRAELSTKLIT